MASIAEMVANGLSNELQLPGEHYTIPLPAVWVSAVTKMRYALLK